MAQMAGCPNDVVDQGRGLGLFGGNAEAAVAYAYPYLRYCPECIANGYHCILFQYPMLLRCPIHGTLLSDVCPRCQQKIPFHLPTRRDSAFCCKCGHRLWLTCPKIITEDEDERLIHGVYMRVRDWVATNLKFSDSAVPMREAVTIWSQMRGLDPTCIDAETLLNAASTRTWRSRSIFEIVEQIRAGPIIRNGIANAYLDVERAVFNRIATGKKTRDPWLELQELVARYPETKALARAYVIWRVFWERPEWTNDLEQRRCAISDKWLFAIKRVQNPAKLLLWKILKPKDVGRLKPIVMREWFWATYAFAVVFARNEKRLSRYIYMSELSHCPEPILLIARKGGAIAVRCIHHPELTAVLRSIRRSRRAKTPGRRPLLRIVSRSSRE